MSIFQARTCSLNKQSICFNVRTEYFNKQQYMLSSSVTVLLLLWFWDLITQKERKLVQKMNASSPEDRNVKLWIVSLCSGLLFLLLPYFILEIYCLQWLQIIWSTKVWELHLETITLETGLDLGSSTLFCLNMFVTCTVGSVCPKPDLLVTWSFMTANNCKNVALLQVLEVI